MYILDEDKSNFNSSGQGETYAQSPGVVMIEFNNGATLAHELKHAYQFEMGDLSAMPSTDGGYSFYLTFDINDEVDAQKRQFAFSQIATAHDKLSEITPDAVRGINNGNNDYKNLPAQNLSAFSTVKSAYSALKIPISNKDLSGKIGAQKGSVHSFYVEFSINIFAST